jgi:hypothetical protein
MMSLVAHKKREQPESEKHEHECKCCAKLKREVECMHRDIIRLLKWIALKEIDFVQVGGTMNYSMQAGTSAEFDGQFIPTDGSTDGSTPQWGASDGTVELAPSTDGKKCVATLPLPYLAASFDLTFKAVSSDPTIGPVTKTHTITVTQPPPPPPPNPLTAVDFVQVSG